jgi:hypothetical protein
MEPSDPKHTPNLRPTGDLEHLFRQKFAEAEVTPRASLWEQLDHQLLVQQNETYRRRLLNYRWAAAASLLLLVGGGTWFGIHSGASPTASTGASQSTVVAGAHNGAEPASPSELNGRYGAAAGQSGSAATGQEALTAASAADSPGPGASAANPSATEVANAGRPGTGASDGLALSFNPRTATNAGRNLGLSRGPRGRNAVGSTQPLVAYGIAASPASSAALWTDTGMRTEALVGRRAGLAGGTAGFSQPQTPSSGAPATVLLAAQPAPTMEQEKKQQEEPIIKKPRRWKFNAAYAAAAFNPNANFSRNVARSAGVSYSDATSFRSAADAYEAAAAEYRQYLQAGLGQRVSVTADYALNKHWSLVSGVSVAQQEATSATSWYFLDGKSVVASFFEPLPRPTANVVARPERPLYNVSYRYRTASVPVSVRYTSGEKKGWAVYAKLGAAVNVLFSSRSELKGVPEATRIYNLTSTDSPYRKVQTSMRGGAGLRFRPANATWSLAVGPDLEAGLTTLNANPSRGLSRQSRPYSVGLEASVEFGGTKPAAVMR